MEGEGVRPLDMRLEQVTASLKASLDEVCGTDVQRLDTSESVRIEEVLAIASEAAREVVSIRRKRRQGKRPRTSGPTAAPLVALAGMPAADASIGAHRVFVDERGVRWDAFAVMPSTDRSGVARLPEQYRHGWLCFESSTEKRRLGPIPALWQKATDAELRQYRNAAQPVVSRTDQQEQRGHTS